MFQGIGRLYPVSYTHLDVYKRQYHKFRATADAVEEMGLRALLAGVCFDHFKPELAEKSKRENEKLVVDVENYSKRIRYAVGPHAIYTCLLYTSRFAKI